jgi:hypothetical protein
MISRFVEKKCTANGRSKMGGDSVLYAVVAFLLLFLYVAHIWEVRNGHE